MRTVLVTSRSFSTGSLDLVADAAEHGVRLVRGPAHHDPDALAGVLARAEGWIAGTAPVTAEHLAAAPHLRIVARYGVGYEAVDLAAARAAGVRVTNTPGANSASVADMTLALMLAALRHVPAGDRRVRSGDWSALAGRELGVQRVGLIGFGRIGQLVATRLAGFGATVLAHDPWQDADTIARHGVRPATLAEIAATCDVVSLHCPGGQQPVDAAWLATVKPGLVLVNTARADLVDEDALVAALRDGRVASVAADTLAGDVAASGSALLAPEFADRVIVTPHVGAQTVQAVDHMGLMALTNVLAVLAGDEPPHPVV